MPRPEKPPMLDRLLWRCRASSFALLDATHDTPALDRSIHEIVASLPRTPGDLRDPRFTEAAAFRLIERASVLLRQEPSLGHQLTEALDFIVDEWIAVPHHVQDKVLATLRLHSPAQGPRTVA